MEKTIRRQTALEDMELHENPTGGRHVFSIKFVTKDGEVVYMPYAFSSGLRADMTKNRLRGVTPCTANGVAIGHVTPVCIDNILEYNHIKVTL